MVPDFTEWKKLNLSYCQGVGVGEALLSERPVSLATQEVGALGGKGGRELAVISSSFPLPCTPPYRPGNTPCRGPPRVLVLSVPSAWISSPSGNLLSSPTPLRPRVSLPQPALRRQEPSLELAPVSGQQGSVESPGRV